MYKRLIGLALLSVPSLASATASKVAEHTLRNGLKILVKEDHRSPLVVSKFGMSRLSPAEWYYRCLAYAGAHDVQRH